jgi:hypothetical protein
MLTSQHEIGRVEMKLAMANWVERLSRYMWMWERSLGFISRKVSLMLGIID